MIGRPDLNAFRGLWTLRRRIRDLRAGQIVRFQGEARFDPKDSGLSYRECGVMAQAGQSFTAERAYHWREDGALISVTFSDGGPFHTIAATLTSDATHHCDPDLYRVRYDFRRWPNWRTCWQVSGPKKEYQMLSVYAPAAARS